MDSVCHYNKWGWSGLGLVGRFDPRWGSSSRRSDESRKRGLAGLG